MRCVQLTGQGAILSNTKLRLQQNTPSGPRVTSIWNINSSLLDGQILVQKLTKFDRVRITACTR